MSRPVKEVWETSYGYCVWWSEEEVAVVTLAYDGKIDPNLLTCHRCGDSKCEHIRDVRAYREGSKP